MYETKYIQQLQSKFTKLQRRNHVSEPEGLNILIYSPVVVLLLHTAIKFPVTLVEIDKKNSKIHMKVQKT